MTEVPAHTVQDHGSPLDLANDRVAAPAQESAYTSERVKDGEEVRHV